MNMVAKPNFSRDTWMWILEIDAQKNKYKVERQKRNDELKSCIQTNQIM